MAKKIRFPLEMENGIEVRTIEELKDNFSLQRVLQYLENGKLITWLRDRYSDDIADAIENLDKTDAEMSKKLCEIFEVDYNEQEDLDMEKIEERNRKLTLLKQFTDKNSFVDAVDYIAFEQDDLYDLLDEGAETIYLCGEKFSIPLGKGNVSYIGINNPVAVISSKEAVDFKAKRITFENCVFDEKYSQLISSAESEGAINSEETIKATDLSSEEQEQIAAFVENMIEEIDEAITKVTSYDSDEELYYEDEYDESDFDAYGEDEYIYETKAKAKSACKQAVTSAVSDMQNEWETVKKEIISTAKSYCDDVINNFLNCLRDLRTSYDEYVNLECEGKTAEYILSRKTEFFMTIPDVKNVDMAKNFSGVFTRTANIISAAFTNNSIREGKEIIDFEQIFNEYVEAMLKPDKDIFNVKKYFDLCGYDDNGGKYCFYIFEACCNLNYDMKELVGKVRYTFPDTVLEKYREAMVSCLKQLKSKIYVLAPEKISEKSENENDEWEQSIRREAAANLGFRPDKPINLDALEEEEERIRMERIRQIAKSIDAD